MGNGVGMLSVFTAFIASWFMDVEEEEQGSELRAIRADLEEIKKKLGDL